MSGGPRPFSLLLCALDLWPDPNSVQLNPTQSNSIQPNPTQSNPIQPNPTQPNHLRHHHRRRRTSAKTDKAELEAAGTAAALEGTTKLTELDKREIEWTASVSELRETYATREASEREASACLGLGQDQLTAAKSKLDMQKKEDGLEKTNLATKNEVSQVNRYLAAGCLRAHQPRVHAMPTHAHPTQPPPSHQPIHRRRKRRRNSPSRRRSRLRGPS